MSKLHLCVCVVAYLLMVAYVQHDNSRIKWRKAFSNTFIAPILYAIGILLLLLIQGVHVIRIRLYNLYQGKQTP